MLNTNSLIKAYLDRNPQLSSSTKETAERAFRYFSVFTGNIQIHRLNIDHFEQYRDFLFESGRSRRTANLYVRVMQRVFAWAVKQGMIRVNPVVGVDRFKIKRHSARLFEPWEFQRLYETCGYDLRWEGILLSAKAHGLRRGEILNMTRGNIRDGFFHVEPKEETPVSRTWAWQPKGREIRKIPVIPQMQEILDQLSCFYPFLTNERYENLLVLKGAGTLQNSTRNCPEYNFSRVFVEYQKRAFGRQIGDFHGLRKTYIAEMLEMGIPRDVLKKIVGYFGSRKKNKPYTGTWEKAFEFARQQAAKAAQRSGIFEGSGGKPDTDGV